MKKTITAKKAHRQIKAELALRGMTVADLALQLKYSPGYLANVICGRTPRPKTEAAIERYFSRPFWSGNIDHTETTPTEGKK